MLYTRWVINKLERMENIEQYGISVKKLNLFMQDLIKSNLEYHSIMLIKDDKVAYECYAHPYSADIPHTMYSVSKSIISTAVGMAISEGLLTLDTYIAQFFPEYAYKKDKRNQDITIKHLLTMSSGKEPPLLTNNTVLDWVEMFFNSPFTFNPGESYRYTSENTYILSVIIVKLTKMSVTDYLMPRLFDPLFIDRPFWETDHNGIECGGWGIYLKTEDLAKITLCYKNKGIFNNKQVIPRDWAEEATAFQIDNSINKGYDRNKGYGYCFWRNSLDNSYRLDGMLSQFGIVMADYNACLIMTAGQFDETGGMRKCIWRHFPDIFNIEQEADSDDYEILENLKKLSLPQLATSSRSPLENIISGKTIMTRPNLILEELDLSQSILPHPIVFMAKNRGGSINNIVLEFDDNYLYFSWTEKTDKNRIKCSMNGDLAYDKISLAELNFNTCASASWLDENTLVIWIRLLETVAMRIITMQFNLKEVKIKLSSTPSDDEIASELADGSLPELIRNKLKLKFNQFSLKKGFKFLNPTIKGKIK